LDLVRIGHLRRASTDDEHVIWDLSGDGNWCSEKTQIVLRDPYTQPLLELELVSHHEMTGLQAFGLNHSEHLMELLEGRQNVSPFVLFHPSVTDGVMDVLVDRSDRLSFLGLVRRDQLLEVDVLDPSLEDNLLRMLVVSEDLPNGCDELVYALTEIRKVIAYSN
jgi:hypothetical protein